MTGALAWQVTEFLNKKTETIFWFGGEIAWGFAQGLSLWRVVCGVCSVYSSLYSVLFFALLLIQVCQIVDSNDDKISAAQGVWLLEAISSMKPECFYSFINQSRLFSITSCLRKGSSSVSLQSFWKS
ncbi:hypothetical protein ACE6H2_024628 [Prunus campanulata]